MATRALQRFSLQVRSAVRQYSGDATHAEHVKTGNKYLLNLPERIVRPILVDFSCPCYRLIGSPARTAVFAHYGGYVDFSMYVM